MQPFWAAITIIGSPEIWLVIGLLPLLYLIIKNKGKESKTLRHQQLTLFAVSIISVLLIVVFLKISIGIPRPCVPCLSPEISACNPYCPSGLLDIYSFPSGHAASIFAAFTALYIASRRKIYILLFFIPILVALSRFYLGVHTTQDIIAGTVIGIAVPIAIDAFLLKFSQSFGSSYKRH